MSQPKPSEQALEIAERFTFHNGSDIGASRRNADGSYSTGECLPGHPCKCDRPIRVQRLFLAIDAAIAEAEAATEERIASKLVEWAGFQSSLYAASALEHAAAAIRAREEKP